MRHANLMIKQTGSRSVKSLRLINTSILVLCPCTPARGLRATAGVPEDRFRRLWCCRCRCCSRQLLHPLQTAGSCSCWGGVSTTAAALELSAAFLSRAGTLGGDAAAPGRAVRALPVLNPRRHRSTAREQGRSGSDGLGTETVEQDQSLAGFDAIRR